MRTSAIALVAATAAVTAVTGAGAVAGQLSLDPAALSRARTIKVEVTARYVRGPKLAVTEASSTDDLDFYLLLTPDLLGLRVVPTDNGIYYAICPIHAICPYPAARSARSPFSFSPRREALELAARTFLETSATLVAVSLPTSDYVFFLVERDELAREVDIAALVKQLSGNPNRAPATSLRHTVDELTLPRLFASLALEPTSGGGVALGAVPLAALGN
jgi:hypothetical protein